ncbi:MAG: hypothetical protein AAGD11_20515 [Planctomycetota bacterium]
MRALLRATQFRLLVVVLVTLTVMVTGSAKESTQELTQVEKEKRQAEEEKKWPKDTKSYARLIDFSGRKWSVKAQDKLCGPGPNYFSDRAEDVWADDEGLHLTISKRDENWYCTEVILQESFGYGNYIFQTSTEPDSMDANVIAGMFTWEAGMPWPNRELDFEFARWSNPKDSTNAQFAVQPFTTSGNMVRYRVAPDENDSHLTQVMTWRQDEVRFRTARGRFDSPHIPPEAVIIDWTYSGDGVPEPGQENVRVNLWLDNGAPPASEKPIELVVKQFLFVPIEK